MKPSLKCLTSLNKITQIRREKQANYSDMVRKSGKSFRLGEKFRLASNASTASREKNVLGARLSHIPRPIITTRIAGGLLLGYNPKYTCPGLKSFALHFVQVTIAM